MERRPILAAYELMFIVKPELDEEQVNAATDRVHQLVVANGGTVTKTAAWGRRRLAYKVGQYNEGYYIVSNFTVEPAKISELERVLKISDTVFRHLLVRRDKPITSQTEVHVPDADEGFAEMMAQADAASPPEADEALPGVPAEAETDGAAAYTQEPVAVATAEETADEPQ